MNELELVRLHEDGETLVLAGADGARFTLPIDDALRAAVRRDRTQLEQLRAQAPGVLPVREIQSQLRAGHSAREVAEKAGIPIEQVRRFEGPVLAEQEFVVEQVRKNRLGHDEGSLTLGELVTERLTARGVEPEDVEWSAARPHGAAWTVTALFLIGDRARSARWSYDPQSRSLHALEDEARWLSGASPEAEPVRGVRGAIFDHAARGGGQAPSAPSPERGPGTDASDEPARTQVVETLPLHDETTSILDDLSQRRGVRAHRDDDPAIFEGFGPPQTFDLGTPSRRDDARGEEDEPAGAKVISLGQGGRQGAHHRPDDGAHPSRSARRDANRDVGRDEGLDPSEEPPDQESRDAHPAGSGSRERRTGDDRTTDVDPDEHVSATRPRREDAGGRTEPAAHPAEPRRSGRKPRASVPSWDEIVFGAKPEH
ncbi:septation protein SepH [Oerskovia sp. NPDC057915]|uniref:septation protein SepH n=1 Tax=Oerskovia sp. NPDC057915 TaxID=3346280 RepID=UPI0036DA4A35